jgi:hypothetical protein
VPVPLPAGCRDARPPDGSDVADRAEADDRMTAESPFVLRGHAQVTGFFDGLELVAPGMVSGAAWRPG